MNKKRIFSLSILVCITLLAAILRLYKLGEVPVSVYWDEVAFGYNAYSILKTGADEYGAKYPLLFRSFDDYKLPGYLYLSAPSISFFGLNEFSVRFVSAVCGIFTVILVYFLVKLLYIENIIKCTVPSVHKKLYVQTDIVGLGSALFLAISPWHIQFSRAGFEANASLLFIVMGTVLFLFSLKKNWSIYISMFCFSLSLYFYRGAHVFVPLFLIVLFIIYFKCFSLKTCVLSILLFFIISIPLVLAMTSDGAQARANQVFIGNQKDAYLYESALQIKESDNALWARLVYNRRFALVRGFLENYVRHFGVDYLLTVGDPNLRHNGGGAGMLYFWQIPFVLIGSIGLLLANKKKYSMVLFLWLFIAPVASSLSYPSPHALRSLYMIVPLSIISFFGVYFIYVLFPKSLRLSYFIVCMLVLIYSFYIYLNQYYRFYPQRSAGEWGDGYKQMVRYVEENKNMYDRILISGHYWKPYMYMLFYTAYDPALYQVSGSSTGYGKFIFGGTGWGKGEVELDQINMTSFGPDEKVLIILSQPEYEKQKDNLTVIKIIKNIQEADMFIVAIPKR